MIKKWKEFNESYNNNDIDIIMDYIMNNITSEKIPSLINDLTPLTNESMITENVIQLMYDKLSRWFNNKLLGYIVNKKANFYTNLVGKLDLLNLTTLDDIENNFKGFKLDSIYLAGGMNKAKDVGAGWRALVEYEFEVNNPGIKSDNEPVKIPVPDSEITVVPAYIVDDINLSKFIKKGNRFISANYDRPAILNPVRKEVDRTKNKEFGDVMGKFKRGEFEDTNDPRVFDPISKVFSQTIEPEDEIIVNICDAVFVGFNDVTSGGTFGELQQTSFLRKPIFAWYIDDWKISGHSPWNLPHISKIMRTEQDMKTFVKTMVDYNK